MINFEIDVLLNKLFLKGVFSNVFKNGMFFLKWCMCVKLDGGGTCF